MNFITACVRRQQQSPAPKIKSVSYLFDSHLFLPYTHTHETAYIYKPTSILYRIYIIPRVRKKFSIALY